MRETSSPRILGVYLGHDLGACLLCDGELVVMIEEERLNRFKHGRPDAVAGLWPHFAGKFGYFPWASVAYCLAAAGLAIDDLDLIVLGDNLWAEAAAETVHSVIPIQDRSKVVFVTEPEGSVHHFHHALTAFYGSRFERAAVLVIDADGNSNEEGYEAETGYFFADRRGSHRLCFKNRYTENRAPKSGIGWMYEQTTYLLGFCNPRIFLADAGKTMGLAAHGRPRPELAEPWLEIDGFKIDFSGFQRWMKNRGFDREVLVRTRGLATRDGKVDQYAMDVAYKVQAELERGVLALAEELQRRTGATHLCFAGGVALNSVANGLLRRRGIYREIFIQPAAHDGGQALGLACHGHLMLTRDSAAGAATRVADRRPSLIQPLRHAFGGRPYSAEEHEALLTASGLDFTRLADDEALAEDAASEISRSRIVGWFQGGSEIGPRALGHRSILADPSVPGMKDRLNARVKFRETFRPFAPSVLAERASEVFDLEGDSPYMLIVTPVRQRWRDRVPAIVHCDDSARIQTVDAHVDPLYHRLISAFEKQTGIPLVLNTSFNLQGMPIVETPSDALQCFLSADFDCLYLGPFKVSRPDLHALVPAWHGEWEHSISSEWNGGGTVLEARHEGGLRSETLSLTPTMARILHRLDGRTTLGDARRSVAAAKRAPTEREVLTLVQRLIRSGALELRVGRLTFRFPDERRHWWQTPLA